MSVSSNIILGSLAAILLIGATSAPQQRARSANPAGTISHISGPDWKSYNMPAIIDAVYKGNLKSVPDDVNGRDYIAFVTDRLGADCALKTEHNIQAFNFFGMYYKWHAHTKVLQGLFGGGDMSPAYYAYANTNDEDGFHKLSTAEEDGQRLASSGCHSDLVKKMWVALWDVIEDRFQSGPMTPNNQAYYKLARVGYKPETAYSDNVSMTALTLFEKCDRHTSELPANYGGQRRRNTDWCHCIGTHIANAGFSASAIAKMSEFSYDKLYLLAKSNPPSIGFDNFDARMKVCSDFS